jgi:flagellar hook-associated protein 2
LNSLISQINSDSRLKDLVVASNSGGSLVIESKRFGTPGDFSVSSNLAAGADNSGIGTTGGTKVLGLNVAGTINGEAATGNGQFLIGNSGNANTDGLQIQYTGTTTGGVGSVSFTRGVASLMSYRVGSFTDSVNGLLTAVDQSLKSQVEDIQGRIDRLEELVTQREQTLRLRYAAMEEAIGRFNSQGSQLGAIVGGLNR